MKIAIVVPSHVPFMIGGVENVARNLFNWINDNTKHQAELIKLPAFEDDFWGLLGSYESFYRLDLNHFDMVISTKYPAWMVQHNNHICYMHHCLRGLYDTYHMTGLPLELDRDNYFVNKIMDYIDNNKVESLEEFWNLLHEIKSYKDLIPERYFSFPGPLIREIIHFLDGFALSKGKIKRFYSISETVKKRKEYFPENAEINVLYPPTTYVNAGCKEYKHLFMVSRLDAPKRIDLLIKAMKYVKTDVKLYIAGNGPEKDYLQKMALGDSRIVFLGFVNDDVIEDYYSNCIAVPYFPKDEDYGLITIEAMLHRKPVITTIDSGGPTEFVLNGETGFVTKCDPIEIAEKIDYIVNNIENAKEMGENAYNLVKDITWKNVCDKLLKNTFSKDKFIQKKVCVVSTFPIFPPMAGGQVRTYNLFKQVAQEFNVEIVSHAFDSSPSTRIELSKNFYECRVRRTDKFSNLVKEKSLVVGAATDDVLLLNNYNYAKEYVEILKNNIKLSDIVVLSHPFLWNALSDVLSGKELIYDAQDVEVILKKQMYNECDESKKYIRQIFEAEKAICTISKCIYVCSEEDKINLVKTYKIDSKKIFVIPNGVDVSKSRFVAPNNRKVAKKVYGLENERIGVFIGSSHKPNIEAVNQILGLASQCTDTKFIILGSVCNEFKLDGLPQNVGMLGVVDEKVKNKVFSLVDFALNPMMSGTGTNVKVFDYMASGIPVITTEIGARGIECRESLIISTIDEFKDIINSFDYENYETRISAARKYVLDNFDWELLGNKLLDLFHN